MQISERFSTHLKNVLAGAIHLATDLNNLEVTPLHLFYCLLLEKGSVAGELLMQYKIRQKDLQKMFDDLPVLPTSESEKNRGKKSAEKNLVPLSGMVRAVMERTVLLAQSAGHNYLGTEHLLKALIDANDEKISLVLNVNNVKKEDISRQLGNILKNISQFPNLDEVASIAEEIKENMSENLGDDKSTEQEQIINPLLGHKKHQKKALEQFAVNLTDPVIQKNIDPVIGRNNEVERLIQIIGRRTKNNPVLLGEPGVGKTAIVEGFAKKIISGDVPEEIKRKKVFAVDMGLMIAGTIYRGEFEARLKKLIDEASADPDIILFIDELHNIVGAGSNQGTMDAANILKPALARGHIRCIGSTTVQEFKKYIEGDPALERRFQPIMVREPSVEDTIKILKGIRKNYEQFHRVKITDQAVEAAVKLSDRHIGNKFLPDKAIDLLDETASAKKIKIGPSENKIRLNKLKEKLKTLSIEKEKAALGEHFGTAIDLKEQEIRTKKEVMNLEEEIRNEKPRINGTVEEKDIIEQVAKITGTEMQELILNRQERFKRTVNEIKKKIIGQDKTIEKISQLIQQAQLGISHPDRPLASILLIGESGTGKTETAKVLSQVLYPGRDALIKLDMSEFNESFGVSKLLGSPAGYVGYKEANQFTDKLKLNPYSIVLFDEIDKAHPQVLKLLLQILENGEITDSTGKKISLKHAIILLTTSYAAEEIKKEKIGFGQKEEKDTSTRLKERLKERFSPELVDRLDQIHLFTLPSSDDLIRIAALEINQLNERLKKFHTRVKFDHSVLNKIIGNFPKGNHNARDIRQMVRGEIESLVGVMILQEKNKPTLKLVYQKNNIRLI